jgi:formamidopyrimidine-DNA glycosylase
MPELPEVETIARQLNIALRNKVIKNIEVYRERCFQGDYKKMCGWKVVGVSRKSKVIGLSFVGKDEMVIIHLKMTGQLIVVDGKGRIAGGHPTADWINDLPSKHTRVVIRFDDGAELFFNDMRMFGWMKLVSVEKYEDEIKRKAPDVIDGHFTSDYLRSVLSKSGRAVKLVLMDQEKIGGVGNIYANDALYMAGIMPDRKASSLSDEEVRNLYEAVQKVIFLGIEHGGASAANYVDTKGLGGEYQDYFLTYKQDGKPCKKCGEKIKKMKLGGRGTFYCVNCQK